MNKLILANICICFISFCGNLLGAELYINLDSPKIFDDRISKPLTDREKLIVGDFKGNSDIQKWEISQKGDGTYEVVSELVDDGEIYRTYARGIWGIIGEQYYYMDLLGSDSYFELDPEKISDKIVKINGKIFSTTYLEEGKIVTCSEQRVTKFKLPMWDRVNRSELKDILSEKSMSKVKSRQLIRSINTLNISNAKNLFIMTLRDASIDDVKEFEKFRFTTDKGKMDWLFSRKGLGESAGVKIIDQKAIIAAPMTLGDGIVMCFGSGSVRSIPLKEAQKILGDKVYDSILKNKQN